MASFSIEDTDNWTFKTYERRFFVKIVAGKGQGPNSSTVYYKRDLTFEIITKWRWYFEYRASLLQVENPRWYVRLSIGSYKFTPPLEEQRKQTRDQVIACKRMITKISNNMVLAKKEWNQLWPIEENEMWVKSQAKLDNYKERLVKEENILKGIEEQLLVQV